MDFSMLFQRVGKVAAQNTPAILTALGVTGTFTTALLAAKAGFNSVEVLKEAEKVKQDEFVQVSLSEEEQTEEGVEIASMMAVPLTKREKTEAVWKLYVPAAASAALTVSAIVLASNIMGSRNAALAAAYTTVERSYTEYRAKNIERIGKKKEEELRAAISQDRINKNPPTTSTIIVTGRGTSLVMDGWSGRCFYSTKTEVDKAVNDFNSKVLRDGYGSLSEFWAHIDLPPVDESNMIGWSSDKILEIDWDGAVGPDDEPALTYSFRVLPNPRFASAY
jgi:hypothetical protein